MGTWVNSFLQKILYFLKLGMDQAAFIVSIEPHPGHGRWKAAFPQSGDFKIKIVVSYLRSLLNLSALVTIWPFEELSNPLCIPLKL
jgi:hypothetical protein